MEEKIIIGIEESIESLCLLKKEKETISKISEVICKALENKNKVIIFGNGGSAADSQHFAAELVGRFVKERVGFPAIALTTDTSILTAIGNDYGFEKIFERQIEALAKEGDILIGISTSGNSPNVIFGLNKGKEIGTTNISFTGKDGGKIKEISDLNLNIHMQKTSKIQEAHEVAYHLICEIVEEKMTRENRN